MQVAIIDKNNNIEHIADNIQEAKKWIKNMQNPIWVKASEWYKSQNKIWKIIDPSNQVIWSNQ